MLYRLLLRDLPGWMSTGQSNLLHAVCPTLDLLSNAGSVLLCLQLGFDCIASPVVWMSYMRDDEATWKL